MSRHFVGERNLSVVERTKKLTKKLEDKTFVHGRWYPSIPTVRCTANFWHQTMGLESSEQRGLHFRKLLAPLEIKQGRFHSKAAHRRSSEISDD
jgi:hypothetical protein